MGQGRLKHRQETPKWQPTHEVEVRGGAYLAEIMGRDVIKVNSYHHQGIKDLADGLVVSGRSSDGVVGGRRGQGPLGAVARRRAVARRGDARCGSRPAQPLRGPRLGRRAPRPAPGRGIERTAAQTPRGIPQGRLRNRRGPGFLRQVHPGTCPQAASRAGGTLYTLHPRARRYAGGRTHQGDRAGAGP